LLCLIVMPASVALFVIAGPLTVSIFHYGQFTATDVMMTRWALMGYAFALLGWSLIKVLAPGYYARQDTRTPMRIAMWSLGVTMGLNLIFVVFGYATNRLNDQGLHVTLALTNAVGAIVNAYMLYRGLRTGGIFSPLAGWRLLLLRIVIANIAMGLGLHYLSGSTELWLELPTWTRVWRLSACVIGGAAVYFAALWLSGARVADFRAHKSAAL
jgi:putative peptidoglycan lipid II flippase